MSTASVAADPPGGADMRTRVSPDRCHWIASPPMTGGSG